MSKSRGVFKFLVVALCVIAGVAHNVAAGDEKRQTGNVSKLVEQANVATETRFRFVADSWRNHVADLKRVERLRRVASSAIDFEEKFSQAIGFFDSSGGSADRMRASIRKHVADERVLAKSMADAFASYQTELLDATVVLYGRTGINRATAIKAFPAAKLDPAPLERAFDPVVKKAQALGTEDWFRFAAVNAGSAIVADGIEQVGRSKGSWKTENGGVADFFLGLITQIAVEAVIDTVTDPTEQFAKQLQTSMATAERELLDGPNGLLTAMRNVTTLHQQSRLKHHGLVQKGGK
ncbi:MAG: hypothetical protein R3C17_08930 [Planctomycetaceae bacterium]